ncbi:MAG TPA: hypothetical protein DCM08_04070 [Microscillaceae bacterium]|nr:hypothetical protein [Microscillaceae bacterium]
MKEARLVTDLDKLLMLLTTLGTSNQIPAMVFNWFDNFEHLFDQAQQAGILQIKQKANGIFFSFEEETQFFFYHQKLKHTEDMALLHQALQLSQAHLFELREETQNSFIQLEKSTIALQYIARHQALQQGDLPVLLHLITETLANFSKTSRVSIWQYKSIDGKMGIVCLNLFDLQQQQHLEGGVLLEKDFPVYFAAIKRQRVVKVNQARNNPITIGFLDSYLIPNDIFSMLDVPYFISGELGGVICFEQQKASRDWTYEDVAFATSMSAMLTIAFLGVLLKQDNQKIELINEVETSK